MTQQEKIEIKKTIEKEIESLTQEVEKIQEQLKPIKKDCSLDSIDHKILKQDQNITIQRYEVAKKRLNRLKAAYLNVDTDEYGVCKECEEDINTQRLKLIPESQYCVACMNELGL
ncbi:TraR/DksA family transcriptional regulator [Sulfurimonas autotrophica]|uniref:Transcriptional regulator, TraR/DksA family n=1 Tax=Sulfurimonas autotrophica (strain ATCC BAA-671 / DSM 16294 / JCM 11897 / OK10) TaxID=563040 RepID=E0UTJ7_SULAO|nr:TraR/DksA C4-type zinc finger protein [Sulfurimonas autotrophica]ADN09362.1 transcriptional regulator, TraR/DksA family [Sulfurimonas autotrophica DSM 16294]